MTEYLMVTAQTEYKHSFLCQRSPAQLPLQQGFWTFYLKSSCEYFIWKSSPTWFLNLKNPLQQGFRIFYLKILFNEVLRLKIFSYKVSEPWNSLQLGFWTFYLKILSNKVSEHFISKPFKSQFWKRFCNVVRIDFLSHLSSRLCSMFNLFHSSHDFYRQ